MGSILVLVLVAVGVGAAYVRLAPINPERWHVPVRGAQNKDGGNFAVRVVSAEGAAMRRVHEAMIALPRTRIIAGNPEEGAVTYVTRSRIMGYPDLTTVEQTGQMLKIYARSRFGGSDFGVNAARADRLVAFAEAG